MRKYILHLTLFGLILLGWAGFANRQTLRDAYVRSQQEPVPEAITAEQFKETAISVPKVTVTKVTTINENKAAPAETPPTISVPKVTVTMNLKVPFIPQAPFKVWDAIHQDACEEASILMVQAYVHGETSLTLAEMERRIQGVVEYQNKHYGEFKDSDAARTAEIMTKHLGMKGVRVLPLSSADDIKRELRAGRPIILPAAGKELHNPNVRNGGPIYHMLVIKGFTPGKFITNDPGTRLGENYIYDETTIMNAAHDWNNGDVMNGAKMMIVVE